MYFFTFFGIGILAAFLAFFVELFAFSFAEISLTSIIGILVFVCIEEIIKLFSLRSIYNNLFPLQKTLLSALAFGFGFGAFELSLSLWKHDFSFFLPMLTVLALHILTSLIIGYGWYLTQKKSYIYIVLGFFLALLLHALYNLRLF